MNAQIFVPTAFWLGRQKNGESEWKRENSSTTPTIISYNPVEECTPPGPLAATWTAAHQRITGLHLHMGRWLLLGLLHNKQASWAGPIAAQLPNGVQVCSVFFLSCRRPADWPCISGTGTLIAALNSLWPFFSSCQSYFVCLVIILLLYISKLRCSYTLY